MQSVELTNEAVEFLKGIFNMFDIDNVRITCLAWLSLFLLCKIFRLRLIMYILLMHNQVILPEYLKT